MTLAGPSRVWLVTGASRGLGRQFTRAALEAGNQVVATARSPHALDELAAAHPGRLAALALDVDDRAAVFAAVDQAVRVFGRLDVVVNNAGWGLMGAIEEVSEAEARAQLDTNFFGALWVTQAVLPHLRAQGSGHILQISTVGGIGTFPTLGLYNASKWALEGFSEALAQEVAAFGITVTIVEPGGFATDWATTSMRHAAPLPAYEPLRAELSGGASDNGGQTTEAADAADAAETVDAVEGDPAEVAQALLELANRTDAPLRQLVGADAYEAARIVFERRRDDYRRDPHFTWPT